MNAENILVRDFARQQELLLEALQGLRVAHHALPDYLDGDHAVERFVVGLVDAAHTAFAEQGFDAVARAEILARRQYGGICELDCYGLAHRHGGAAVRTRFGEIRICVRALRAIHIAKRQRGSRPSG